MTAAPLRPPLQVANPVGIGWRPEIAGFVARLAEAGRIGFCELIAEGLSTLPRLPEPVAALHAAGLPVVPHGVTLSLGGVAEPDPDRIAHLARCAQTLGAPLVSEHLAFVRATVDGRVIEAGHLLPVPRTAEALDVLTRNIRLAQAQLPVPLAVEPVAALLDLGGEYDEGDFLTELVERTGVWLLLDVANVYANALNHGGDPAAVLARMPLERIAYCHVAGGRRIDGLYRDTHLDPTPPAVLDLVSRLAELRAGVGLPVPPLLLERDGEYPAAAELEAELVAIGRAATAGAAVP
jgi:uncharacterized protein (UPF0276 family)